MKPLNIIVLLFLTLPLTNCSHQRDEKDLLGSWTFEKFSFDSRSSIPESDQEKFTERNKGTTITFYEDNKFVSERTVNGKVKSISTKYTLLDDKSTLIIQSDTLKIVELNNTVLRLHRKNSPDAIFKRT